MCFLEQNADRTHKTMAKPYVPSCRCRIFNIHCKYLRQHDEIADKWSVMICAFRVGWYFFLDHHTVMFCLAHCCTCDATRRHRDASQRRHACMYHSVQKSVSMYMKFWRILRYCDRAKWTTRFNIMDGSYFTCTDYATIWINLRVWHQVGLITNFHDDGSMPKGFPGVSRDACQILIFSYIL